MARNYRNIGAWQRSHQFVLTVYGLSANFPETERFGLVSQMRRAAVSVPANIAEGAVRDSQADFLRFLTIAQGSLSEVDYFLYLAKDLGYVAEPKYAELHEQISRVFAALYGLIKAVRKEKDSQ